MWVHGTYSPTFSPVVSLGAHFLGFYLYLEWPLELSITGEVVRNASPWVGLSPTDPLNLKLRAQQFVLTSLPGDLVCARFENLGKPWCNPNLAKTLLKMWYAPPSSVRPP